MYVKKCKIFGQILIMWVKLIIKKNSKKIFQCLTLPKDPQSFLPVCSKGQKMSSEFFKKNILYLNYAWISHKNYFQKNPIGSG